MIMSNLGYINVFAYDNSPVGSNFCSDFSSTLKLISISILIVRILVPLLIIIMGTIDIYKIVIGGKDDDFKKQMIVLGKRVVIGAMVFFLPSFVNVVVNAIDGTPSDYKTCLSCISNPSNCSSSKK